MNTKIIESAKIPFPGNEYEIEELTMQKKLIVENWRTRINIRNSILKMGKPKSGPPLPLGADELVNNLEKTEFDTISIIVIEPKDPQNKIPFYHIFYHEDRILGVLKFTWDHLT